MGQLWVDWGLLVRSRRGGERSSIERGNADGTAGAAAAVRAVGRTHGEARAARQAGGGTRQHGGGWRGYGRQWQLRAAGRLPFCVTRLRLSSTREQYMIAPVDGQSSRAWGAAIA